MNPVRIECQAVELMIPTGEAGTRAIELKLSMTETQVRAAILDLLGGMDPGEALGWLKSERPSLFEVSL